MLSVGEDVTILVGLKVAPGGSREGIVVGGNVYGIFNSAMGVGAKVGLLDGDGVITIGTPSVQARKGTTIRPENI